MLNNKRPLVLVVAGLDSGGGAGITADCITIHETVALRMPCNTALTPEFLKQVASVVPTDDALFIKSLSLVSEDYENKVSAVKVGLVLVTVH